MPLWVAALLGGFVQAAGTLVGRVLISLGFGYVSFTGMDAALTAIRDAALSNFSALPAAAVGMLSIGKVGVCVSILTSALAARLLLDGLTGGVFKRMVLK